MRTARRQRDEHLHELTDERAAPHSAAAEAALRSVLDLDAAQYAKVARGSREEDPDAGRPGAWNDATAQLQNVVETVVRALRPATMVETGVARGYTSAAALGAMEEVGHGRLLSIDLPSMRRDGVPDGEIGSAVPDAVRKRWTLRLGPSRRLLEPCCARWGRSTSSSTTPTTPTARSCGSTGRRGRSSAPEGS